MFTTQRSTHRPQRRRERCIMLLYRCLSGGKDYGRNLLCLSIRRMASVCFVGLSLQISLSQQRVTVFTAACAIQSNLISIYCDSWKSCVHRVTPSNHKRAEQLCTGACQQLKINIKPQIKDSLLYRYVYRSLGPVLFRGLCNHLPYDPVGVTCWATGLQCRGRQHKPDTNASWPRVSVKVSRARCILILIILSVVVSCEGKHALAPKQRFI